MRNRLVILKLGGSVITKKEKVFTPNLQSINRLAREISCVKITPLILIHGGGSYGHPIAKAYRIDKGYTNSDQLLGLAKTHDAMVSLNILVTQELLDQGLPALGMAPSSFIITNKGRIEFFNIKPLKQALNIGLVPILYGDIVLDAEQVFTILSGDQISAFLAVKMNAERLIMGVDVDGLFDSDPKTNPSANLISRLTLSRFKEIKARIGGSCAPDVTGGMLGKVSELIMPVKRGVQTLIVNASKPGYIYKALKGEEIIGTKIEP